MSVNVYISEFESLRNYCTYQTGGQARYFAMPKNVGELENVLTWARLKDISHEIIGYGANLLISDKGYDGLVICLREFEKQIVAKNDIVYAGAGVLLNDLVKYACENGFSGMECLSGIPGTLGGAVRMNAGAYGIEIGDIVSRINILELSSDNKLAGRVMPASEAVFAYRSAEGLNGKIVTAVEVKLEQADKENLLKRRQEILKSRAEKQPLDKPSCGSVFKRPKEGYAGALIEKASLKGVKLGGAQVSQKHANFIINDGTATSQDIYSLILHVKLKVLEDSGVILEEEVRYVGEFK